MRAKVIEKFRQIYGGIPELIVRAPGRVNLIGEHTDYNEGFVLPMAIDRAVWIALKASDERAVNCFSLDYHQQGGFSLTQLERGEHGWIEYLKGVAWTLQKQGFRVCGWQGVLAGDVPQGAGLSSSAALEIAAALAFCTLAGEKCAAADVARLGQRVENEWLGLKSGVMDQMISAAGVEGHALLLDCRDLTITPIPLPQGISVLVLDSATRRGLVGSAYNERRESCEKASRCLGVPFLRDAGKADLEKISSQLDEVTYRRARHVIGENERTLAAAAALQCGDAVAMGALMRASHDSMRDDFEISTDHLNLMVALANHEPACYGARMTGGGFGGCAVALVDENQVEEMAARICGAYRQETGLSPVAYVCRASQGAQVIK